MNSQHQEEAVAKSIWKWNQEAPVTRTHFWTLRKHGLFPMLMLALVYFVLRHHFHHPKAALIPLALGTIILLITLFIPSWLLHIKKAVFKLGMAAASVVSFLLLVPFFYVILGILRLFMSLSAKDPMQRRLDRNAHSYWKPRESSVTLNNLERQF
jgi:hypothetical protein